MKNFGWDIQPFKEAEWIEVKTPADWTIVSQLSKSLDNGESEAIALALELKAEYLLINERKGWNIAKSMGVNAIGLISVLISTKSEGIIKEVLPILDK